jgi:hypothetical protein
MSIYSSKRPKLALERWVQVVWIIGCADDSPVNIHDLHAAGVSPWARVAWRVNLPYNKKCIMMTCHVQIRVGQVVLHENLRLCSPRRIRKHRSWNSFRLLPSEDLSSRCWYHRQRIIWYSLSVMGAATPVRHGLDRFLYLAMSVDLVAGKISKLMPALDRPDGSARGCFDPILRCTIRIRNRSLTIEEDHFHPIFFIDIWRKTLWLAMAYRRGMDSWSRSDAFV